MTVLSQGSFISEMEWAPFKCLFLNVNESVVKLMEAVFLCDADVAVEIC